MDLNVYTEDLEVRIEFEHQFNSRQEEKKVVEYLYNIINELLPEIEKRLSDSVN